MHSKNRLGIGAKLVIGFVVVLIVIYIVNQPTQAATTAGNVGSWLSNAGTNVGSFLQGLFN